MGSSKKAQELREFLSLAIKLRLYAKQRDTADPELFLAAAETLEQRARHLAFGEAEPARRCKIDMIC